MSIKVSRMPNHASQLHPGALDALKRFLKEDMGHGDMTTRALGIKGTTGARIFPGCRCVVSGGVEAAVIFELLGAETELLVKDGSRAGSGETVLAITGNASQVLAGERVALNLISKMSGIATLTDRLVEKCRKINPSIRIACTRKTTPGLRDFEKRAVMAGGGDPHRWGLDDAILIKDNHLAMLPSITEAVRRAKGFGFTKKIEIEVENHAQALEAAEAGADIIMLDNFTPEAAAGTCRTLKEVHPHITVEVSGGINPENIGLYALSADVISLGWLTHSVKAIDFSLEMSPA